MDLTQRNARTVLAKTTAAAKLARAKAGKQPKFKRWLSKLRITKACCFGGGSIIISRC